MDSATGSENKFLNGLAILLRLLLGAVFIWSGYQKSLNLDLFYQAAQNYHILTPEITAFYAGALPWLEIFSGVCVLLGVFMRFSAGVMLALLVSFLIAIGYSLINGNEVDCGCFLGGTKPEPVSWGVWFRDLLMAAGAAFLMKFPGKYQLDRKIEKFENGKMILVSLVSLYLLVTLGVAINTQVPPPPPPPPNMPTMLKVGAMAPDFTLKDLGGKEHSLKALKAEKKLILLEFFATWCPHCQHSVIPLNQVAEKYKDKVTVLSINAGDQPGQPTTAPAFRDTYGVTYPILDKPTETLLKAYEIQSFPTLYLLDPTGKVLWNHTGTLDEKAYPELVKTLD